MSHLKPPKKVKFKTQKKNESNKNHPKSKTLPQSPVIPAVFLLMAGAIVFPFFISGPLLVVATIGLLIGHRHSLIDLSKSLHDIYFMLLSMIGSALLSQNQIGLWMPLAFLLFAWLFSMYRSSIDFKTYMTLLKILLLGSSFPALNSFFRYFQYLRQEDLSLFTILNQTNSAFRAESTFFNANYYGLYLVMILVLSLAVFVKPTFYKLPRWVSFLVFLLNLGALILTQSRMVYPALLGGWILYLASKKPKWGLSLGVIGGAVLLILIINPQILPRFGSLAYAFQDRFDIWQVAGQIFLYSPLMGRGAFSYLNDYYLFSNEVKMHAHQLLVDWLANYGLIGLFLTISAIVPFLRKLSQKPKSQVNLEIWQLIVAMVGTVLIHSLLDVSIVWLQTGFVFLTICLYPMSLAYQKEEGDADGLL